MFIFLYGDDTFRSLEKLNQIKSKTNVILKEVEMVL